MSIYIPAVIILIRNNMDKSGGKNEQTEKKTEIHKTI